MELGGRLRNKLFVKKDVKTTVYKEPNNQETGITTLKKKFPYLSVLTFDISLRVHPNASHYKATLRQKFYESDNRKTNYFV